ncbi:MAG TPA: glycoside hydrolase family 71/99-like protein [Verrucomicrobiae bacterium]|nr:glycoside hydrolase family 71/99-like protein [Verrucomicrobiae bacterium]
MKLRSICSLLGLVLALGPQSMKAGPKPVMVHYMPWFVAKPFSSSWGWHWTMNHFNPDSTNSSGQRQIASWYYPQVGPYDSDDSTLLEYQVLLMKLAGVDGIIVDWYGPDNYNDYGINNQRTTALFQYARKAGLKFCLCYEDQTIQQEINGGYITSANAIAHAQQTMLYVQTNYFSDPAYLKWNNQPVFLNFGPQYFKTNSQWQTIFSVLTNAPAFFTEDNRLSVGAGAFDWPPMWASQTNSGVLSASALENYLNSFQQNGAAWPAFISSAFPRFHDIYQQAGVSPSYGSLDDASGATFRNTLSRALTNKSAIVQIVTWNDYGEGTVVEPTVDYNLRDLGTIQDLRRQYLDGGFPYHTNDLAMAARFYSLRRQYSANRLVSAELDRAFTNIVSANLNAADLQLHGMEASLPVIYNLSLAGGLLEFSVGGFIFSNGAQVQTSSNLSAPAWQTIDSFSASTNQMVFSTPVSANTGPAFFKVQASPP